MSAISSIRDRVSRLNLQTKAASVVLATIFVAVNASNMADFPKQVKLETENLTQMATVMTEAVSHQVKDALAASTFGTIDSTLAEFTKNHSGLLSIELHDRAGALLSESSQQGVNATELKNLASDITPASDANLEGMHTNENVAIFGAALEPDSSGEARAHLTMVWDMAPVYAAANHTLIYTTISGAIAGLVTVALIIWLIGRMVSKPIGKLETAMEAIANHQYDAEIPFIDRGDEIGTMAQRLAFFRDRLAEERELRALRATEDAQRQKLVAAIAEGLSDLADGRVDRTIDASQFDMDKNEAEFLSDFNKVVTSLRQILSTVTSTAENVRNSSEEIAAVVIDQSKRSEAQAITLEESAAAIESLSGSVEQTAGNAADAKKRILENRDQAKSGGEIVEQTVQAMKSIEASSDQITAIIGVIDDIAFQTNLLALNAGVEAARAGEAGRGFAVVASEVRALAQRASSSANEIKELITRSGEQVTNGSRLVNVAGDALQEIIEGISHASDLVSQIATSSRDQANNLAEIKDSVTDLDRVTQRNAAMIEESSAASRSLSEEAARLMDSLQVFTLDSATINADVATWEEDLEKEKPVPVATVLRSEPTPPLQAPKPADGAREKVQVVSPSVQAVNDADAWADF